MPTAAKCAQGPRTVSFPSSRSKTASGGAESRKTIAKFPQAKLFKDFRKLFDEYADHFDAVCVAIPDFAHFPVAMLALHCGKHVYVEKPMARTFYECELLMAAARRHPELATQVYG